jgi:hypothetical protein
MAYGQGVGASDDDMNVISPLFVIPIYNLGISHSKYTDHILFEVFLQALVTSCSETLYLRRSFKSFLDQRSN